MLSGPASLSVAETRRRRRIAVVVAERVRASAVPLQVEAVREGMVAEHLHAGRLLDRDPRRVLEYAIAPDRRAVSAGEVEDPERPVLDGPVVEDDVARRPKSHADPPVVVPRDVVTDHVARRPSVSDLDPAGVAREVVDRPVVVDPVPRGTQQQLDPVVMSAGCDVLANPVSVAVVEQDPGLVEVLDPEAADQVSARVMDVEPGEERLGHAV